MLWSITNEYKANHIGRRVKPTSKARYIEQRAAATIRVINTDFIQLPIYVTALRLQRYMRATMENLFYDSRPLKGTVTFRMTTIFWIHLSRHHWWWISISLQIFKRSIITQDEANFLTQSFYNSSWLSKVIRWHHSNNHGDIFNYLIPWLVTEITWQWYKWSPSY